MLTPELAKEIIFDFQQKTFPTFTERAFDFSCPAHKIRTLIGARRVGKTYLFYQLMSDLLRENIPKQQILFVNFEDERLLPLEVADLTRLLNTYYEMYPQNKERTIYIFFDEIQNVPDWEIFIRRIHDQENVRLNLTGSSSKLMSRELATSLRGRTLSFTVLPFSFAEYLRHKQIDAHDRSSKGRSFIVNAFEKYLVTGGLPEILDVSEMVRLKILQDYFNLILFKDLVERYDIRNYSLLKYLLKYLVANTGNPFSVNKFFNDIKSQGFRVSKDTLHSYVSYLEDAFTLSLVMIYSESIRKQYINYRKIYIMDHGLTTSLNLMRTLNSGRLLETAIYHELCRRYQRDRIFYYLTGKGKEIDFLIRTSDGSLSLYQVCYTLLDVATRMREFEALTQAMEELGILQAKIITANEWDSFENQGRLIRVVPFWEWALEKENDQVKII